MIVKIAYCSECGAKWYPEGGEVDYRCPECDSRAIEVRRVSRAPSVGTGFHIEEYNG